MNQSSVKKEKIKIITLENVLHKKSWHTGAVQINVEPPPITLSKSKFDLKRETEYVKIKFRINYTSEKLDMYKLKLDLFENGKPEELLLVIKFSI